MGGLELGTGAVTTATKPATMYFEAKHLVLISLPLLSPRLTFTDIKSDSSTSKSETMNKRTVGVGYNNETSPNDLDTAI